MKKQIYVKFLLIGCVCFVNAYADTIQSQPELKFDRQNLEKNIYDRELVANFNTGVLYLENKEYLKAIEQFKKSAEIIKIPSYLNIAIAYYKLESYKNAYM
ncbi:MAG: hypothetical protein IE909_15865, partial [Campylobacterales bacterium]|nr:hypothetical protein [Campylobacterales bacterium]